MCSFGLELLRPVRSMRLEEGNEEDKNEELANEAGWDGLEGRRHSLDDLEENATNAISSLQARGEEESGGRGRGESYSELEDEGKGVPEVEDDEGAR
jgi:hypothetical protein